MKTLEKLVMYLSIACLCSCYNEPIDLSTIAAENIINVDSELYDNLERIADKNSERNLICINFEYAFTLNVFDENLDFIGIEIIGNVQNLSTFLGGLPNNHSISLSYPITGTTEEGLLISIDNNDDLKAAIDLCLKEERLGYCNAPDCLWKVLENNEGNTDFENAYFNVSNLGQTSFLYQNNIAFGTWVAYYIENELHLNINLMDDTNADIWNKDWKVTIIDDNTMMIENENRSFLMEKECYPETCKTFEFQECALNENLDTGAFILENYIDCIAEFSDYEITDDTDISFHLSQIDAENNTNVIAMDSVFHTTENPQVIFTRFENTELLEIEYTPIALNAVNCETN